MSEIKVNKISPRAACGTTTLGDSGDTFTIPAGVTITNSGTANGFGATGAVNWQTTVKTSGFTAVNGEGYFVDTSSGGFTVNLPAGSAGAVVGFKDYANTFDTGNLTLDLNGSDKAGGSTGNPVLTEEGLAVTLVFIDSTKGWLVTDSGLQSEASELKTYVTATGGNAVLTCGDFKTHVFTSPGTFCVSCAGNPVGSNEVSYVVVAGGGGAGYYYAAGGAGGYREGKTPQCTYTQSPLACTSGPNNGLPVSVQGYSITVGGGGAASASQPVGLGANGGVSTFSTITSAGGGGGRGVSGPSCAAGSGGSGGSAGYAPNAVGNGKTPPVSPPQGNNGGSAAPTSGGGGGGGAGAVGGNSPGANTGGLGGIGVAVGTDFFGATAPSYGTPGPAAGRWFAGGGSAANCGTTPGTNPGGAGGGGFGKGSLSAFSANAGTTNTGGGAGGGGGPYGRSSGGSGIVMIRYKFQN